MSEAWEQSLRVLLHEWSQLSDGPAELDMWQSRFDRLVAETDALRSAGHWRSGPRTLLAALGLRFDELRLTAGLGWLLRPDGHHGLGDGVLRRLCAAVGSRPTSFDPVTVQTEETRSDTRADLVVRMPGAAVLVEAKVRAGEQPRQCARLAELWAFEEPALVFLTPDGRCPATAGTTRDLWHALSWADVADMVEAAARGADRPAPGVFDYLTTLRGEQ